MNAGMTDIKRDTNLNIKLNTWCVTTFNDVFTLDLCIKDS